MFSRDKIMLWQSSPDALIININFFYCWSLLSDSILTTETSVHLIKVAISSTYEHGILKMSMLQQ